LRGPERLEPRCLLATGPLLITEVCANNDTGLIDDLGYRSDWIEIHNPTASAVNLDKWYLTDNPAKLTKWQFPAVTVAAGAYKVVFASGLDHQAPASPLHTSFKLGAEGGYLALVQPDGKTVSCDCGPNYPIQYPDMSFGQVQVGGQWIWRYLATPSPAAANSGPTVGPLVRSLTRNPAPIAAGSDQVITAHVVPTYHPVAQVIMYYRVMYGNEVAVLMRDDGTAGDATAADSIYTAVIPRAAYAAGQMVRWYVTAVSTVPGDGTTRAPMYSVPALSQQYFGTVVADPAVQSSQLPVFYWFVQNPSLLNGAGGTSPSSFYYNGQFCDNVNFSVHGQSTSAFTKKSFNVDLNREVRLEVSDGDPGVKDFNLLTDWADKSKVRNTLAWETHRDADVPALDAFPVRIQQNGQFWSVADWVEETDSNFLDRVGLDSNGALYKIYDNLSSTATAEKKTRTWEDASDLQALINGAALTGTAETNFFYDNLDLPEIANYLASIVINANVDLGHKNYYVYHDTDGTGQWQFFPWDVDLTFGHNWTGALNYFDDAIYTNNGLYVANGNMVFTPLYAEPGFRQMYLRRVRTLMDQLLQPPGTPAAQLKFEARIDQLVAEIDPHNDPTPALGTDDADLDYQKWGSWGNMNTTRQGADRIKNEFLPARRTYLYTQLPDIPAAQVALASLPANQRNIAFGTIEHSPASGNQDQEFLQIINNNTFAVDMSGWKLTGGVTMTFDPGTVVPAGRTMYVSPNLPAFRARTAGPSGNQGLFVVGSYKGHLSANGETINLVDDQLRAITSVTWPPSIPSAPQQFLRITELNFDPSAADTAHGEVDRPSNEFEYVEVLNTSTQPLDLTGVQFTNGITFTFPPTMLQPGQYGLVVKDLVAFQSRYGTALKVLGSYTGSLDNSGEKIRLEDAEWGTISEFTYGVGGLWPSRPGGKGSSLEVISTNGDYNDPRNWRASTDNGGSPGWGSAGRVVINEVLAHTDNNADKIELYNITTQPVNVGGWFLSNNVADLTKYQISAANTGSLVSGQGTGVGVVTLANVKTPIAVADVVDLYWQGGTRYNVTVDSLDGAGNSTLHFDNTPAATGDLLPTAGTQVFVVKQTLVPAHGYLVLTAASQFNSPGAPGCNSPFGFSEHGDDLYVSSLAVSGGAMVAGDYREHETWGYTPNGRSIGRWVTSTGDVDFTLFQTPTFGAANSAPYVGPLVVSELMYNPLPATAEEIAAGYDPNAVGAGHNDFEFIELVNRSAAPVALMADVSGNASNNYYVGGGVGFTCGWYQDHSGTNHASEVWTLEPGATVTWTATQLPVGTYDVYAHYTVTDANGKLRDLDDAAQYTIAFSGGGSTIKIINQDDTLAYPPDGEGEVSVFLGAYVFEGTGSVTLARDVSDPTEWTIADTIEFRPSGQPTGTIAQVRALHSPWTDNPNRIATLAPGAYAVLVSNLAAFNIRYHNQDGHIPVLGTYGGRLADSNDSVKLYASEQEWDTGVSPYYQYDHVHYYDHYLNGVAAPWPTEPDGTGPGVGRLATAVYGNEGSNWGITNFLGTPGAANLTLDPNPPTVPTGLVAQPAPWPAAAITLTWDASTALGSYVDRYVVYRDGVAAATVAAPHAPPIPATFSYTDTNILAPPVSYSYQVQAVNRDQYASALSSAVVGGYATFVSFAAPSNTLVEVNFSEAVTSQGTYTVSGRTVQGVVPAPDKPSAVVTLDPSTPLVPGTSYTITINNATTVSGRVLPGSRQYTFTYQPPGSTGTGSILREYWTGISGTAVSDLTSNPNFPSNPTGRSNPITFDATPTTPNWADNYGTRLVGYVCPPTSGEYVFWMAADETAELWLSTDENSANKVRIATVSSPTAAHEWGKYAEQHSAAIWLGAGRKYYIEALHKEGTGNDNVSVAWQTPGTIFNLNNGKPIAAGYLMPLDIVPPVVTDISLVGASVAKAGSVQFAVTFSEPVTGVDPTDFYLTLSGATGTVAAVSGSGASYTVTVSNIAGDGFMALGLVDNDSIRDLSGNPLGGPGPGNGDFIGPTYPVDGTSPAVVSVNRSLANPTNAASLKWAVVFSESVSGVDIADFRLALSGPTGTIASVTGSGASYTVTANVAGVGTAGLNVADDDSIADTAGNPLDGTGVADPAFVGQVYNVDTTVRGLTYWLKPITGGSGDYTISGSYTGGDPNSANAYVVSISSLPSAAATVSLQLYASIAGKDTNAGNDTFTTGLLDILNGPGPSALVGQPSPVALRSPLNGSTSSPGQVNGDINGDGGLDLGGALSVTTYPGGNSAWVKPFASSAALGTTVNANGWTDILLGTLNYTYGAAGGVAGGQSARLWTAGVSFTGGGLNSANVWKLDNLAQRESDGTKIGSGPAVTIVVTSATVSVGDASGIEGDAGTADLVFPVTLTRPWPQPVQVTVDTTDGTATLADNDYQALHDVVTFAPGETSKYVTVHVNGDAKLENDETFSVVLSGVTGGASLGTGTAVGTILNDDRTLALDPTGGSVRIVRDPASQRTHVFFNGAATPTFVVDASTLGRLDVVGAAGDDQLTLDFANGNPLPAEGLVFRGGGATTGDGLVWKNTTEVVRVSPEGITAGASAPVVLDNVSFCTFSLADSPNSKLSIDGVPVRLAPGQTSAISANTAVEIINGGVLDLNGNDVLVSSVTVASGTVLHGQLHATHHQVGGNASIAADLCGQGGLEKDDEGTAVLVGDNDYRGGTVVEAGTLLLGNPGALPYGGAIVINAGATVVLTPGLITGIGPRPVSAAASDVPGERVNADATGDAPAAAAGAPGSSNITAEVPSDSVPLPTLLHAAHDAVLVSLGKQDQYSARRVAGAERAGRVAGAERSGAPADGRIPSARRWGNAPLCPSHPSPASLLEAHQALPWLYDSEHGRRGTRARPDRLLSTSSVELFF
jgi:autotransporter-associated beta strand protein